MRKSIVALLFMSSLAAAGDIKKWVDEKGNVHYGDQPPSGQTTETIKTSGAGSKQGGVVSRDKFFLLGRWKTDPVVYEGKTIPSQIYTFDNTMFSVEGNSAQVIISDYSFSNGVVSVAVAGIVQRYTIVDDNTVSYTALGLGKQLLHRL